MLSEPINTSVRIGNQQFGLDTPRGVIADALAEAGHEEAAGLVRDGKDVPEAFHEPLDWVMYSIHASVPDWLLLSVAPAWLQSTFAEIRQNDKLYDMEKEAREECRTLARRYRNKSVSFLLTIYEHRFRSAFRVTSYWSKPIGSNKTRQSKSLDEWQKDDEDEV